MGSEIVKQCKICKKEKELNHFHKCRKWHASYCKPCQKKFYKKWTNDNKEDIAIRRSLSFQMLPDSERKNRKYLQRYGISFDEYNDMLKEQGGVCKICFKKCRNKSVLSVDHCHITGVVRGLLCDPCNNMLGKSGDQPEVLRRAADYLEFYEVAK